MVMTEWLAREPALDVSELEWHLEDEWELDPTRPADHELSAEDPAWVN